MGNYNRNLRVCMHQASAEQTLFNRAHQMNIIVSCPDRVCRQLNRWPCHALTHSLSPQPLLILAMFILYLRAMFCHSGSSKERPASDKARHTWYLSYFCRHFISSGAILPHKTILLVMWIKIAPHDNQYCTTWWNFLSLIHISEPTRPY